MAMIAEDKSNNFAHDTMDSLLRDYLVAHNIMEFIKKLIWKSEISRI